MNRRFFLTIVLCLGTLMHSWANDKLSVSTQAYLSNRASGITDRKHQAAVAQVGSQEYVDVFIALTDAYATAGIEALGAKISARFSGIVTARVPYQQIEAIASLEEVERISIAEAMEADLDSTRSATAVNLAAEGLRHGLPANYTGKGVVFGIIDSGIDFNHAAFQDSLGHTRIKRLYMPKSEEGTKVAIDGTVLPGTEFDSTAIATLTNDYDASTHGTHTACIGVGSSHGAYVGMAPEADIVMCAMSNNATDVNIANSLKYIVNYAKSVGKPCVISVSIGKRKGPHDGTSNICKIYDEVGENDAVICLSAGNYGGRRGSLHHKFTTSSAYTSPTFGTYIPNTSTTYTSNFAFDVWSRSRSVVGVKFVLIDPDDNSLFYETGIMRSYTYHYIGPGTESKKGHNAFLTQYFSGKIGVWVTTESNGHSNLYTEVQLKPLDSSVKAYKVGVQFYGSNGVEFDAWMISDNEFAWHAPVGNYKFEAGNDSCSINDNATGEHTISVGNYVARNSYTTLSGDVISSSSVQEGSIYYTSSYGIAPNGKSYPFVTAPGYTVTSAFNGYNFLTKASTYTVYTEDNPFTNRTDYWGVLTGTSMSAPTVAGIVALWMQANPSLKVNDVRDIIARSAFADEQVRQHPGHFGCGKINALGGFPEFPFLLTDILNSPRLQENRYYTITDSTLTCMRVSADGKTIYAKDASTYAHPDTIADGQVDYVKEKGLMPDSVAYDQSNWALIRLPQPLDSAQMKQMPGKRLKNVAGMLANKTNFEIIADRMPAVADTATAEPPTFNTFVAANYHGSQQADTVNYFFVKPKPMEVDTIRGAFWNANSGKIEMADTFTEALQAAVDVDFSYLEKPSDMFVVNSAYDFVTLTRYNEAGEPLICPLEILSESVSENTLAEVLTTPQFKQDYSYVIADTTLRVMWVSASGATLYVKDANAFVPRQVPDSTQVDILARDFDQSHWAALQLPAPLSESQKAAYPGKFVKKFRGLLKNKSNPEFQLFAMPEMAETDTTVVLNAFIPANLQGSQELDSVRYFFIRPKPMEIDTIHNAMWNGLEKKIHTPLHADAFGMMPFVADVEADLSLFEGDSTALVDNTVYDIIALTQHTDEGASRLYPLTAWNPRDIHFTLAEIVNNAYFKEGMTCQIADSTLVVMRVDETTNQLFVKDDNQYAQPSYPAEGQTDVLHGAPYDQSNWMLLSLPDTVDVRTQYSGKKLAGVKGVISNVKNPEMRCSANPTPCDADTTQKINNYIIANFYGSQKVDTVNYFFVKPKPMEVDTIRYAMWNSSRATFTMPYFSAEYGYPHFSGSVKPDYTKFHGTKPTFAEGDVCDLVVMSKAGNTECYVLEVLNVTHTEFTLAKLLNCDAEIEGYAFPIKDNTLAVMGFSPDYMTIYTRDDGLYAHPDEPAAGQKVYQDEKIDQSNWLAINLMEPMQEEIAEEYIGRYLTDVSGYFLSKESPEMEVMDIPGFDEVCTRTRINNFLPANYVGSQTVDSVNYFFVKPKPMEIDTVRCAIWNASAKQFEMPFVAADFGHPQFDGKMNTLFYTFDGSTSQLVHGHVYDLLVQARKNGGVLRANVLRVLDEQTPSYTLAQLLTNDRIPEGYDYELKPNHLTVMHIASDSLTIYAKDAEQAANVATPAEGEVDVLAGQYAGHNWVAISLPDALDSTAMADYPGKRLQAFEATLTCKTAVTLKAQIVPESGEPDTTAFFNAYLPANFVGSQKVDTVAYFLSRPMPNEIDTVRYAVWDAYAQRFVSTKHPDKWNLPPLAGHFNADISRLPSDSISLTDSHVYHLITLNEVGEDSAATVYVLKVLEDVGEEPFIMGDVNDDGMVDVADITLTIDAILGEVNTSFRGARADMNGDDLLDVADVTLMIQHTLEQ
ncbi:MAG: S8 family serine peptidase [Sodaliphilus sp.]